MGVPPRDSPFLGPNGEPRLVECAVVFFDLLGVSAMAGGSGADAELVRFDRTIRDAFPYAIGAEAGRADPGAYPAAVFSDSMVAAVPISSDLPPALAIFQLASDVAKLQTRLATADYFARGAITLDKFHCHDGLLFGPALVEAVALERDVAVDPRIVLSPAAATAVHRAAVAGSDEEAIYDGLPVLVDEDGAPFVDYLGGVIEADVGIELQAILTSHRDVVAAQLERQATDYKRWRKQRWVAEYHNATCSANRKLLARHGGYDSLLIDSIHTSREFARLL